MRSIAALISAAVISLFIFGCGSQPADPTPQPTTVAPTATSSPSNGVQVTLEDTGGTGDYMFDPSAFTFSVGEEVTFVLISESEFHTFTVDDLGIDVEVDARETREFTFTFNEAGEFALICIPHELLGMTGTITVQ